MDDSINETRGQRSKSCDITNCPEMGRILAKMGTIEIAYCPKHRKKYGERIINALINSVFNYRLSNFLASTKLKIFMSDDFLCVQCSEKMKNFIIDKTKELEALEEFQEENDAKFEEDIKEVLN